MPVSARTPRIPTPAPFYLLSDVGYLLARASGLVIRGTNARLRPLGLRVRHFSILSVVVETGGVSQRELSALLGLDPSQIVSLVDDLERQRLVERRTHGEDRRARVISATREGETWLDEAKTLVDRARQQFLAPLAPPEQAALLHLLARLTLPDLPESLPDRPETDPRLPVSDRPR